MASSSSEEQRSSEQTQSPSTVRECVYKTKLVEFLGRTTPIVLQNDNGPCPLLAICNVLLLKNNLSLSPETTEVSQEKLLSLVAERLIDSNCNIDDEVAENQQKNISDSIDLLPRLATGIDVNIKFRRIDDFEFTSECAIFDLLDIPLYHGWIVDPQDYNTANAIGSKSYNTLMEELVALETRIDTKYENAPEEDCVDFAAATTASLGVPSPCLSKARSFDDPPHLDSDHSRKGDLEEEEELLRALKISESDLPPSPSDPLIADVIGSPVYVSENFLKPDLSIHDDSIDHKHTSNDLMHFNVMHEPEVSMFSMVNEGNNLNPSTYIESEGRAPIFDVGQVGTAVSPSTEDLAAPAVELHGDSTTDVCETGDKKNACDSVDQNAELNLGSSSGRIASEALTSSGSEPIYEGEECIMDPGTLNNEVREPVYEGEVVLANQGDKSTLDSSSMEELTLQAGELIKNFLKSNASQLTINGLFCLQAGLKERELCVFFRNNHFSTMFKFSNELYLLATDQGYISQTDLVWEKLNEVNGDTLFMTGNFKEFKVENHSNDSWNEHNAMSSTADYISTIDSADMALNPDLELAISLQQQEMNEQQQRQSTPQPQQQSVTGHSRLITGPNVRNSGRNSSSSSYRQESKQKEKDKEKCTLM